MKRLLAVVLISVLYVVGTQAQAKEATKPVSENREKFDPAKDPEKDLQEAIATAGKEGKRILLDIGGEWCIWCHRLDQLFAENKDLTDFLKQNYVVVKVNYSQENKNEKFLSKYPKIPGYPHLFVLDEKGKLLHSQDTGELESGKKHDLFKVLTFLKKWARP